MTTKTLEKTESQQGISPLDQYNEELLRNAHPSDWVNPEPADKYNLVVIGAGTAGLVTAAGAAAVGAKVALVEKHLMGGDCLNVGCVPSKGLIRAARAYADVRDAGEFGVRVPEGVQVDFPAVMERMRRLRSRISPNDSVHRFKNLGVDVFIGEGRFIGPDTVEVKGKKLKYKKAVLATGARASAPPYPGLSEAGTLTNETVFNLTTLPQRLAVIGTGPIGCEMAQAFARFGSRVTLFGKRPFLLPREDKDASQILEQSFHKDGITLFNQAKIKQVQKKGDEKAIRFEWGGQEKQIDADEILVGIGRAPNVEGLNLEEVGVEYDTKSGVKVNGRLQTTNPNIYAAGDICFPYKFTHTAESLAAIVIQNALFKRRLTTDTLAIPWCTYTDPEVAHVGLNETEAQKKGIAYDVFTHKLSDSDRAILDGEENGFVKILTKKGKDKILGATIVARHAGEMITEVTLAMTGKLGLGTIAGTIHPYPTQAEAIKRAGGTYLKTKLTPTVKKLFTKWLDWTR